MTDQTQLSTLSPQPSSEVLTARQWSAILGIAHQTFRARVPASDLTTLVNSQTATVYPLSSLPADYQTRIFALKKAHRARSCTALLSARAPRWTPPRKFTTFPPSAQAAALKRKAIFSHYYAAIDQGASAKSANAAARAEWARAFGVEPSELTIRRWVKRIDSLGGPEDAPNEAYLDGKSTPHHAARLENGRVPPELIAHFRALCVQPGMMHITAAHRAIVLDWQNGRPVPGVPTVPRSLGEGGTHPHFPFSVSQLRKFAPSRPARDLGNRGKALARARSLPHARTTTHNLLRAQRYVLDDTRVDIIGIHPITGLPVELKSYYIIDVGPRRIEGFVIREATMQQRDVEALVARTLRSTGVAATGAPYITEILFERGTVACSPARQSFLEGAFPGRLRIHRTGMNGGKNHPGDFTQEASGNWMGKGHVESLMRTLAFFLQHIPGQRGGDYTRQPAQLGLIGRNAEGTLDYTRGSQIHRATLQHTTDRALSLLDGSLDTALASQQLDLTSGRLRLDTLLPIPWIIDRIKEAIAFYNNRTDHRMQGFARIEFIDADRKLRHRYESPNERAARLEDACPTERLSPADAASLLMQTRPVIVRKNGVSIDLAPFKGLTFWKPESLAVQQALLTSTGEKKFIAVLDEDAFLHFHPDCPTPREIHLIDGVSADWKPGQPARYLETLPLAHPGDLSRPEDTAKELEKFHRMESRYQSELLHAAGPLLAEKLANAQQRTGVLRSVVTSTLRPNLRTATHSTQLARLRAGGADITDPAQHEQLSAQEQLARALAKHKAGATS
jgi:hypothetical protein